MTHTHTHLNSRFAALLGLAQLFSAPTQAVPYIADLSDSEVRLAEAIQTTTLRHLGQIDAMMGGFMRQPYPDDRLERQIIRMGLAQLLFMNGIADHAAIDTSVELARQCGIETACPTVNAVLRRAQRQAKSWLKTRKPHQGKCAPWLFEQLKLDYGKKGVQDIVNALCKTPELDICAYTPEAEAALKPLAQRISATNHGWRITKASTNPTSLPLWTEGQLYAQNAAAQLPVQILLSLLPNNGKGMKILDLCAAPGGKSLQLHKFAPEAEIHSVDLSPNRLDTLRENFARCGVAPEHIHQADGTALPFGDATFDAILLDAPCSAIGTARKHPEVLWNKSPEQVDELVSLQQAMITEASRVLKPQGLLAYATCSLLKAESERQVVWAQKEQGLTLETVPESAINGVAELINRQGTLRCLPTHGMDGFFCGVLRK